MRLWTAACRGNGVCSTSTIEVLMFRLEHIQTHLRQIFGIKTVLQYLDRIIDHRRSVSFWHRISKFSLFTYGFDITSYVTAFMKIKKTDKLP